MAFQMDDELVQRQHDFYGESSSAMLVLNAYPARGKKYEEGDVHVLNHHACSSCYRRDNTLRDDLPVRLDIAGQRWTCYDCVERINTKRQRVSTLFRNQKADVYIQLRLILPRDMAVLIMRLYLASWTKPFPVRAVLRPL